MKKINLEIIGMDENCSEVRYVLVTEPCMSREGTMELVLKNRHGITPVTHLENKGYDSETFLIHILNKIQSIIGVPANMEMED